MEDRTALELFAGKDQKAAERAFAYLSDNSRRLLYVFLVQTFFHQLIPDDRQEIIQDTFLKIWAARSNFKNQGMGGWIEFQKKTAYHAALDFLKKKGVVLAIDEDILEADGDNYDQENEIIDQLAKAVQAGKLLDYANVLWLGLDPQLSSEIHTRQHLVAQSFYLHGDSCAEILNWLPSFSPDDLPPTREMLDDWLVHPGVLRLLAYQELFYSNDRLTCLLLGLEGSCGPELLDDLMRQVFAADRTEKGDLDRKTMEIALIVWRYRHALLLEQIARREDCWYTAEEIRGLLDRLTERLPFSRKMIQLLSSLRPAGAAKAREALGNRGLWQRLAFQYRYLEELPHRDIHERTQPAAQHVGYNVTLATLNGWLGNRRLLKDLADYYAAREGKKDDG